MKKVVTYLAAVLVLITIVDLLFGVAFERYAGSNKLSGDYQAIDYLINESNEDIAIFGSSVALNSLIPTMIEVSLGMTCFNGGANAQKMPYYLTMLDIRLKRSVPKLVILGLVPNACANVGVGDRYNILAPYYGHGYAMIDSCMEEGDKLKKLFLTSNLIRLNTIWWRILLYNFVSSDNPNEKGYVAKPLPPAMPEMKIEQPFDSMTTERANELQKFITICKQHDVPLIVYFPPLYRKTTSREKCLDEVTQLCNKNGVMCINDTQDSTFLAHPELFYDNVHLNLNGAPKYTERFIGYIKTILDE